MSMDSRPLLRVLPVLLLAVTACGGDSGGESHAPAAVEPPAGEVAAVSGLHTVRCGCAIEEVRHCGNYVFVEGEPLELTGDIGLGKMEFCGQGDQQAQIEGMVADGVVVAKSYELQE